MSSPGVRYEIMRAAKDCRFGLWAVLLSLRPRRPDAAAGTLKREISDELRELYAEEALIPYTAPWIWGRRVRLTPAELDVALADDRQWRPRKIIGRSLVRLAATETGVDSWNEGAFGEAIPMPAESDAPGASFQHDTFTVSELVAIISVVAGIVLGAVGGWVLGNAVTPILVSNGFLDVGTWRFVGLFAGGGIGLAIACFLLRNAFRIDRAPIRAVEESAITPSANRPDLNATDELGNLRF